MIQKILVSVLFLLSFSFHAQKITITKTKNNRCNSSITNTVLHLKQENTFNHPQKGPQEVKDWYSLASFSKKIKSNANAIRFEVKGNGSAYFASVILGTKGPLKCLYETSVPLDNTDWVTHTLYLEDFVQFDKPWSVTNKMNLETVNISKDNIDKIGFGRGHAFNKFYTTDIEFSIRNIEFVSVAPIVVPPHRKKLSKTKKLLSQKKKIKIMLLGDSITWRSGENNQAKRAAEKLEAKYGAEFEIVNCAIGGHSSRAADVILERSFRTMHDPDLVFLMFGANDSKATEKNKGKDAGFNEDVFKAHMEHLINRIYRKTNGDVDILLVSGVQYYNKERTASRGIVEKIAGAYPRIAKEYELGYVNSLPHFSNNTPEELEMYFTDAVHLKQAGTNFLGDLIYEYIVTEMEQ